MYRCMTAVLLSIVLVGVSTTSVWAQDCPHADINNDCRVDFGDLRLLAEEWLNDSCLAPACRADVDGVAGVDAGDFALLAAD